MRRVRCAIYTRKSSEDGLEQEFNSLHAQREACASYVANQKHEGWVLLPEQYDDGGISGGTLEWAGLQRLLHDVDEGLVDQIVVYKIDRLTRSLTDFAKLVERLDGAEASFVSVTQSFNTSTSMGRLTLNVLLSFAQFEREVTAERIRDKIAASKKKGLWMGGTVPLGYEPDGRTLRIVEKEAETVRTLFDLYLQHGSVNAVKQQADRMGLRTKARAAKSGKAVAGNDGRDERNGISADGLSDTDAIALDPVRSTGGDMPFERTHIHYILTNPTYTGRVRHHAKVYEGQHPAIIEPATWDEVQERLKISAARKRGRSGTGSKISLLAGKLFDETGDRLTPSHANKKGRRYRYYVSNRMITGNGETGGWRLPAKPLEDQVAAAVLRHLQERLPRDLLCHPSADDFAKLQRALQDASLQGAGNTQSAILECIATATVKPGQIEIALDSDNLAILRTIASDELNRSALTFAIPFQFRKRGVEAKLIIGAGQNETLDETLIRSIAKAHQYYDAIRSGKTFEEIAASENLSKRRILQVIDLAFIAPDIVTSVIHGTQPIGLTAKWLGQNPLPSDWQAQRGIAATL